MAIAKRAGMRRALSALPTSRRGIGLGPMVAVARKLAVVLHRMCCDGTGFRWGKGAATA